jgi:hypothetical protein
VGLWRKAQGDAVPVRGRDPLGLHLLVVRLNVETSGIDEDPLSKSR